MVEINMAYILLITGCMVFAINVIVEVTKNLVPFSKIRTNYYVTILGILISVLSYFVYLDMNAVKFIWYYLIAAIFYGFIVAYLAMFGWDKLLKLWQDSQKKG